MKNDPGLVEYWRERYEALVRQIEDYLRVREASKQAEKDLREIIKDRP